MPRNYSNLTDAQRSFITRYVSEHRFSGSREKAAENYSRRRGKVITPLGQIPDTAKVDLSRQLAAADLKAEGGDFKGAYKDLVDIKSAAKQMVADMQAFNTAYNQIGPPRVPAVLAGWPHDHPAKTALADADTRVNDLSRIGKYSQALPLIGTLNLAGLATTAEPVKQAMINYERLYTNDLKTKVETTLAAWTEVHASHTALTSANNKVTTAAGTGDYQQAVALIGSEGLSGLVTAATTIKQAIAAYNTTYVNDLKGQADVILTGWDGTHTPKTELKDASDNVRRLGSVLKDYPNAVLAITSTNLATKITTARTAKQQWTDSKAQYLRELPLAEDRLKELRNLVEASTYLSPIDSCGVTLTQIKNLIPTHEYVTAARRLSRLMRDMTSGRETIIEETHQEWAIDEFATLETHITSKTKAVDVRSALAVEIAAIREKVRKAREAFDAGLRSVAERMSVEVYFECQRVTSLVDGHNDYVVERVDVLTPLVGNLDTHSGHEVIGTAVTEMKAKWDKAAVLATERRYLEAMALLRDVTAECQAAVDTKTKFESYQTKLNEVEILVAGLPATDSTDPADTVIAADVTAIKTKLNKAKELAAKKEATQYVAATALLDEIKSLCTSVAAIRKGQADQQLAANTAKGKPDATAIEEIRAMIAQLRLHNKFDAIQSRVLKVEEKLNAAELSLNA